jgi:hypothetical protein
LSIKSAFIERGGVGGAWGGERKKRSKEKCAGSWLEVWVEVRWEESSKNRTYFDDLSR